MKRLLMILTVAFAVNGVRADEINWGEKLALYLPNRVLDAFDMFSFSLGVGPVIEISFNLLDNSTILLLAVSLFLLT